VLGSGWFTSGGCFTVSRSAVAAMLGGNGDICGGNGDGGGIGGGGNRGIGNLLVRRNC